MHDSSMVNSQVLAVSGGRLGGYAQLVGHTADITALWPSPNDQPIDLTPSGSQNGGLIYGMAGDEQVGYFNGRAGVWHGSAATYADLNPAWAVTSGAYATNGTQQTGWARSLGEQLDHAMLWSGSASSAVDLTPAGATGADAYAISATRQGGQVRLPSPPTAIFHAALWNGTAASFIDMNPAGAGASCITGMWGDQQAGWSQFPLVYQHATIWSGTAQSAIDLHPHPDGLSILYATCGSAQVGYVSTSISGGPHAGIWFGTAASFLDLHSLLPGTPDESVALAVSEINGQYLVGGYARYAGHSEAFAWVGVPAPGAMGPLILAGAGLLRRRRNERL